MTTAERLARAVLDGRGELAEQLADAVLEAHTGFAFAIAEKARTAERGRITRNGSERIGHARGRRNSTHLLNQGGGER